MCVVARRAAAAAAVGMVAVVAVHFGEEAHDAGGKVAELDHVAEEADRATEAS